MPRCLIALAALALLAACETHSDTRVTTEDRGAHHWLFYPEKNIYYCSPHQHYWVYQPANRRWEETTALPVHIDPHWQTYRITEYGGPAPYHFHQEHLQRYRESVGQ